MTTVRILLVEDDPDDVLLTRTVLGRAGFADGLVDVGDGDAALRVLRGEGEFAGQPAPHIVMLDLNLPGRHGLDVLREIKEDPQLAEIPVVVVSTSDDPVDIAGAYQGHASSYVTKPVSLNDYEAVIQAIDRYWSEIATPPER